MDDLTVDRLLRERAALGGKPAVIDPDTRIDYAGLDTATAELAARLVTAGVNKGTRVGLIMPNGVHWVRFALALTRIGAVLVPLSTLLAPRELVAQLRTASVHALICVAEFRGHRYRDELAAALGLATTTGPLACPALPALRRVWDPADLPGPRPQAADLVTALGAALTPADPLAIMFTSGSSGPPKGVWHSHGGALGAVAAGLAARCVDADTRLYLPLPFFWVGGFGAGVLTALLAGATLVTEPVPRPEHTLELLQRERVTLFRGWPDQAEALARHRDRLGADLPALRPGSLEALLPPRLRGRPGARAKLFGMTEAFGPYCGYRADADLPRPAWGSCGKPFPGMQVRIVDPDTGDPVGPGVIGEIQIRGPHVMLGICRRAREEVFTPDGYYPTGDLGHLDADGFLFHHGRADDMFKVSGATVYPAEVAGALREIDGVEAAYVTDVPDGAHRRVGAAVVGRGLDIARLRTEARRRLSAFKVPAVWLLLDSDDAVPRRATGKVDVSRLRELLISADSRETPAARR